MAWDLGGREMDRRANRPFSVEKGEGREEERDGAAVEM